MAGDVDVGPSPATPGRRGERRRRPIASAWRAEGAGRPEPSSRPTRRRPGARVLQQRLEPLADFEQPPPLQVLLEALELGRTRSRAPPAPPGLCWPSRQRASGIATFGRA